MEDVTPFLYNNSLHIFHSRKIYKLENSQWKTVATLEDDHISHEKALIVNQEIFPWLSI